MLMTPKVDRTVTHRPCSKMGVAQRDLGIQYTEKNIFYGFLQILIDDGFRLVTFTYDTYARIGLCIHQR